MLFQTGYDVTKYNKFIIMEGRELIEMMEDKKHWLFDDLVGEIQRNIDNNHLCELVVYQEEYFAKKGFFNFCTPIVIGEYDNKYAIIDGQHRYECLKHLIKKYSCEGLEIKVVISLIKLMDMNEYDEYFIGVNKSKPVKIYNKIEEWKGSIKYIESYVITHYRKYLKSSENPAIPNFNIDKMREHIEKLDISGKIKLDKDRFIMEMEELNLFYKNYWKIYVKKYMKNVDNYVVKIEERGKADGKVFYLSLYKHFEWIDRILHKMIDGVEYCHMEHFPINYRVKIPKKIRTQLWNQYFENSLIGFCYVCNEEIGYDTFESGHIKSVFYGGDNSIGNLRPICGICNRDMGTLNMDEYEKKYKAHL